jgi:hypothetical protein
MNRQLLYEKTGTFDRLRMSSYLTFCNVVKEAVLWKENITPDLRSGIAYTATLVLLQNLL